jgi:hypothetical protein
VKAWAEKEVENETFGKASEGGLPFETSVPDERVSEHRTGLRGNVLWPRQHPLLVELSSAKSPATAVRALALTRVRRLPHTFQPTVMSSLSLLAGSLVARVPSCRCWLMRNGERMGGKGKGQEMGETVGARLYSVCAVLKTEQKRNAKRAKSLGKLRSRRRAGQPLSFPPRLLNR